MSRIAGVVLAAGMSRRLGRPKQLLPLDGSTVIAQVVDRAMASSVDEVVVVIGARADEVCEALLGRDVRLVENERYAEGQGTSLAAGIAALSDETDAAVIVLGDQPGIGPTSIDRLIEARHAGASIAVSRYGEAIGHPVLFGREHFPALRGLSGEMGGREIIRANARDVAKVPGDGAHVPRDIDTEEDWEAIQREWNR